MVIFKKKKNVEDDYALAVLVDDKYDEAETDQIINNITEETDRVGVTAVLDLPSSSEEELVKLQNRFPERNIETTSYVVFKIDSAKLKEETKKMEKKHKYGFFKKIPMEEYLLVEHRVLFDMDKALLYTKEPDEVIRFLVDEGGGR